jgi:hypothetical protein
LPALFLLEQGADPVVAFFAFNTGAAMTKDQEEQAFKVTDRRGFGESAASDAAEAAGKTDNAANTESSPKTDPPPNQDSEASGPAIDFPSYILSYYTQGLVLMGEVPNPYTNQKEEDMGSARNIIDILTMLEQKTKGNLSGEEEKLLETVLYELRMKFMTKTSRIKL